MASASSQRDAVVSTTWLHFSESNFVITLRSHHHKFLCAEPSGHINADRTDPREWESFRVHSLGNNRIALQTHHDTFLCAEYSSRTSRLIGDRRTIGPWETFVVIPASGAFQGKFALLSHHNTYVSIQPNGSIEVNRREVREWEAFDLRVVGAPQSLPAIAMWLSDLHLPHHFYTLTRHGIRTPRSISKVSTARLGEMGIEDAEDRGLLHESAQPFSPNKLTVYVGERAWCHSSDPIMRRVLGRVGKYCIRLGDCTASHSVLLMIALKNLDVDVVLVDTLEKPEWFLNLNEARDREMINEDDWKELPETPVIDDVLNQRRVFSHEAETAVAYLDQTFGEPILGPNTTPRRLTTLLGAIIWSLRADKDFKDDPARAAEGKENLTDALLSLNMHLRDSGGPYLNGEKVTFADLDALPKLHQFEIVSGEINEYVYRYIRAYLDHVYSQDWWNRFLYTPQAVLDGWQARNVIE